MAYSEQRKSEDYQKVLRLQKEEKELSRSFQTNEEKFSTLQTRMDDMRSSESDNPVKDLKAALRLPTCHPPKFSGDNIDYMPWKRTWEVTIGKSFQEEVQLMNLKSCIQTRTCDLIGLSDLREMMDFWSLMDKEYLNYYALCRSAIADVKRLDKKDNRFLQMMHVKLNSHRKNVRGWDSQHLAGNQLMIAKDASQHITIARTARSHSAFSANLGTINLRITMKRGTKKKKQKNHTVHHATIYIPMEVTHYRMQTQDRGSFKKPQVKARKMEPISRPTHNTLNRVSIQEQRELNSLRKQQLQLARRTSAFHMEDSGATKRPNNIGKREIEEWMRSRSEKIPHHQGKTGLNKPQTRRHNPWRYPEKSPKQVQC
jgi:hypothetical protein